MVEVETELKIPDRVSYSATVSGNTVSVIAKKIGNGITIGRSPQAEIHLIVPARSTITAHTSDGPLIIVGITGNGDLETSNGKITIKNVNGQFNSSTSNGSVQMLNVVGEFDAKTSNGKILYSGTFTSGGDNEFSTSNGSIGITFNDEPDVELDARTSNGTVKTDRSILATVNGSSLNNRAHLEGKYGAGSAFLELTTSNGSINIH